MEVLEVWKAVYFLLHVVAQNLKKKNIFSLYPFLNNNKTIS